MAVQELYDRDFFEWTQRNAKLLKQGCFALADIPHIAEELVDMGLSDKREVESFLRHLMVRLLKWHMQPRRRNRSWLGSIADSRAQLKGIFKQSPSLKQHAANAVGQVYPDARHQAALETGLARDSFPSDCPYSFAQLVDADFFPQDT